MTFLHCILSAVAASVGDASWFLIDKLLMVTADISQKYPLLTFCNLVHFILFRARMFAAAKLKTGRVVRSGKILDVTFFDGPKEYTVRFNQVRGPCKFSSVTTSNGAPQIFRPICWSGERTIGSVMANDRFDRDVTDEISKFAGPSNNFYGIPTTPSMLGYDNLTFHLRNDSCKVFGMHDVIVL